MKPTVRSKTIWANIVALVVAAATALPLLLAAPEIAALIPPALMSFLLALNAGLNIVLRLYTSQPLGTPSDEPNGPVRGNPVP